MAALLPEFVQATDPPRPMRIGVVFGRIPVGDLTGTSPVFPGARVLRQSLKDLGWIDGKNLEILWRSTEGDLERMSPIVGELLERRVDVLAISGNPQIAKAIAATRDVPIVMMVSTRPVDAGLVASIARPGGNVTGMYSEPDASLNGKRLALLKQAAPGISRVAFLHDEKVNSMSGGITPETEAAAKALGLVLLPFGVDTQQQLEGALMAAIAQGANALFVDTSLAAAFGDQRAFHALAERHKLPALHTYANAVTTGGLMFYGNDSAETYRRSAYFLDRILRGSKPADLPVQQATTYILTLNMKAAKAIGLTIPAALVVQADRVIE